MEELTVGELMERLRQDTQDDLTREFEGYLRRLIGFVRKRLRERSQAEDVLQSVLASFCSARHTDDKIPLRGEDSLWRVLAGHALRHCNKHNKRFHDARQRAAQLPIHDADGKMTIDPPDTRTPSAEEETAFLEVCRTLDQRLTPRQRRIADYRLAGYTVAQITQLERFYESGVYRELEEIKRVLADSP